MIRVRSRSLSNSRAATSIAPAPRIGNGPRVIKEFNIVLRDVDGKETPSDQGRQGEARLRPARLVARLEDAGRLPHRAGRPQGGLPDRVVAAAAAAGPSSQSRPYPLPGDKFTAYELHVFDSRPAKTADQGRRSTASTSATRRGCAGTRTADTSPTRRSTAATSGSASSRSMPTPAQARNLIDEKTETFIWTAHTETVGIPPVTWLDEDRRDHLRLREGRLAAPVPDRREDGHDQERDHQGRVRRPRHRPDRRGEAAGLVPRQRQERRTRTRTSSTTTASTSTAPAWSP